MRPLAILHLVSSERWTGVADPVVGLAARQSREGHRVCLACIGGYTFEEQARNSGIEILTSLTMDRRLYPVNLYRDYRELRRLVEERRFDIIHSHLLHDNWLAALSLRNYRRPHLLVRTMHRFEWPRRDPAHRWLFHTRTDRILTTSEAMKRRIVSRLGVPPESVDVIFGAVDLDRFHPGADRLKIRREYSIPDDAPVAGIVARLRQGRGHDWLLRAVPKVLTVVPHAHFLIVGRGEIKRALRAEIARRPDRDHLHSTGFRFDDLPECYAAMTCSMFLGQGSEGSCRAILEAMASGRPVIGGDDGGVAEIIAAGRTGLIVPMGDDQALAEALINLFRHPEKAAAMGLQARAECERRFTEAVRTSLIMDCYRRAWLTKYGQDLTAQ